ncbi:hypothetical protein LTS18_014412, partial [Coniosporium uncinatum]
RTFDTNFIDDDDLQANLALQRRQALKKRKKMKPEDLARQLREEANENSMVMDTVEQPEEDRGLVIDETSEFVANLQKPSEREPRKESKQPTPGVQSSRVKSEASPDADGDVNMEESYGAVEDEEEAKARLRSASTPAGVTTTGLEEEGTLAVGIGATLSMMKQRGLIQTSEGNEHLKFREQQRFLSERQKREEDAERKARLQRERDRTTGKLDRMSAREREEYARRQNTQRDQFDSRELADVFNREYKPDVKLTYTDEMGRSMNQKEAFKHLSHQFHGKGSGKQKTEKRLKKIEDEKKREAMSSLDSSQNVGMNTVAGDRAKKARQAGVRLQ